MEQQSGESQEREQVGLAADRPVPPNHRLRPDREPRSDHGQQAVEGDLGRRFTQGAAVNGVPTAGKSGTAELGGKGEPHSWFIGFAPADDPTIAIAVLVERGGRGGERAAPLAGRMMSAYFDIVGR